MFSLLKLEVGLSRDRKKIRCLQFLTKPLAKGKGIKQNYEVIENVGICFCIRFDH